MKLINQVDQLSGYIYKVDQIGKNNSANALIFTLVDSNDVYIREIIGAFNDFEKACAYQARVRICGLF